MASFNRGGGMADRKYSKPEIVVVDDDPLDLQTIKAALEDEYIVHTFVSARTAEYVLETRPIEVAILDLRLPGDSGINTLLDWRRKFPLVETIFCSGESRIERAMECIRRGASDYVAKPFNKEDFLSITRNVREKRAQRIEEELAKFHDPDAPTHPLKPTSFIEFIGQSVAAQKIRNQVKALRRHDEVGVMITGESGTGKEVVAQMLHHQENSPKRPYVTVNMAALPTTLVESELFGVEKGAYTDAKASRAGKFELAHRGDLFLDEIGDLSFESQAKLLRVLQDGVIQRVGSNQAKVVRFRVISATNRNLAQMVKEGTFREDLIFRISDVVIKIPPLRDRKADIPMLSEYFLKKHAPNRKVWFNRKVLNRMMRYHWPGNVRQLESTVKRALVFNKGKSIRDVDFLDSVFYAPIVKAPTATERSLERQLSALTDSLIEKTAAKHLRNRKLAWQELGISKATFYKKLAEIRERRKREKHGPKTNKDE
jgi:DNA-binding NtrC family response regulator